MNDPKKAPPRLHDVRNLAIFLDFDGTLAEFADRPGDVSLPKSLIARLGELFTETNGAVAVVTGRDVAEIDGFLAPLVLPVAGIHGLVRRRADGAMVEGNVDRAALVRIAAAADDLAARTPGVLVERKSSAVALHYRMQPDAGPLCDALMAEAANANPGFKLQRGKAVAEVRTAGHDKGAAITAFLTEAPFRGRYPVFAGDDVTDEDGFAVLERLGGVSIKVGEGVSAARYRVASVSDLHRWLDTLGRATTTEDEAAE